jgi:hypothetical protein
MPGAMASMPASATNEGMLITNGLNMEFLSRVAATLGVFRAAAL